MSEIEDFENDMADNGAFEMDMSINSRIPSSWDILSASGITEPMSSKLLCFFLNPKQVHGLGNFFLREFFKQLIHQLSDETVKGLVLNENSNSIEFFTEKIAGEKETIKESQRYFDIKIKDLDNNYEIHIENKIFDSSVRHGQMLGEVRQLLMKQKRQKKQIKKIVVLLLPDKETLEDKKIKDEIAQIDTLIKENNVYRVTFFLDTDIYDISERVIEYLSKDYQIQALSHFQNFCLNKDKGRN